MVSDAFFLFFLTIEQISLIYSFKYLLSSYEMTGTMRITQTKFPALL